MSSVALRLGRQQVGGGHPSLDLNFVAGIWPPGVSLSRASGATVTCWARYGDNIVTNGDFASGASWTLSGATITGGALVANAAGSAVFATGVAPFVTGRMYRITFSITAYTSGQVSANLYQVAGTPRANVGTYSEVMVAPSGPGEINIQARVGGGFVGTIDNIVVQELCIWQPGMEYLGPELVVNGGFSNGLTGWSASGGATQALVDGELVVTNTANGPVEQSSQDLIALVTAGKTYALTVTARKGTASFYQFGVEGQSSFYFSGSLTNTAAETRTIVFTMPAGQSNCLIKLRVGGSTGTAVFDSVSLRESLAAGAIGWLGPELAIGGDPGQQANWNPFNATTSTDGRELTVTATNISSPQVQTGFPVALGRVYQWSAMVRKGTAPSVNILRAGGGTYPQLAVVSASTPTTVGGSFVGLNTGTDSLIFLPFGGAGDTIVIGPNKVSIREQCFTLQTVQVPANVPRIAYDPVTGACLAGQGEGPRTNLLTHSAGTSRAVGIGSTSGGITTSIVGQGVEDGIEYIDVRFVGTPTGTEASSDGCLFMNGGTRMPAAAATMYSFGAYFRRLSGSAAPNVGFYFCVETAADAFLALAPVVASGNVSSLRAGRQSASWLTPATTAKARIALAALNLAVGVPLDVTFRIGGAQVEAGTEASSFIPSAGAAATRAVDNLSLPISNLLAGPGTLVLEFVQPKMAGAFPGMCLRSASVAQNCFGIYLNGGAGGVVTGMNVLLRVSSATVYDLYLGDVVNQGDIKKVAISWTSSSFTAVQNGGAPVVRTGVSFPAVSVLDLSALDNPCSGFRIRAKLYPRTMTAAELQAVTK